MPAALNLKTLQPALIQLALDLQKDLRDRCDREPKVNAPLDTEYQEARAANRTLEHFQTWRESYLNQVAVAWVLASLFVRYLEEHQFIEEVWLAGEGDRARAAREHHNSFFRQHPELSDREYFHHVFDNLAKLPGCAELFDRDHNPLWKVGLSGDGAKLLREFWQKPNPETGHLAHSVASEDGDTRFLGDLYQNLSFFARKKFALLQTPHFVEDFILSLTLDPAMSEFGLDEVRVLDPSCGSGHFLLGAFWRLCKSWTSQHPELSERDIAIKSLRAVHGVDINPFAVAIARFRLLTSFLKACEISRIRDCPNIQLNVATGDSLLHARSVDRFGNHLLETWLPDAFSAGDFQAATDILQKKYTVVVGNPPYIPDKDKRHNAVVRSAYFTANGTYSLSVPFMERFFDLAAAGPRKSGYVGLITINTYRKRDFGEQLIETFFPRIDLTHLIDCSNVYLPDHGSVYTDIIVARNRVPTHKTVRVVISNKGESPDPAVPALGKAWTDILNNVDKPGAITGYVTVQDIDREILSHHPWSFGGGGASDLKLLIEELATKRLESIVEKPIGRAVRIGEEDPFICDSVRLSHGQFEGRFIRAVMQKPRDYGANTDTWAYYPYVEGQLVAPPPKQLWPWKTFLEDRKTFQGNMADTGLAWYEYQQHTASAYATQLSIVFAYISCHNHFALDRGGKVFKQSTPIIKLRTKNEQEHFALLGLLNSSVVCFYLKQISQKTNLTGRLCKNTWEEPFQYSGSGVAKIPAPQNFCQCAEFAECLNTLSDDYLALEPAAVIAAIGPSTQNLQNAKAKQELILRRMIAVQEELDWLCYTLYGLANTAILSLEEAEEQGLSLGERPFEVHLAITEEDPAWFSRHRSHPLRSFPESWPQKYLAVFNARLDLIRSNSNLRILESPDWKRRWHKDTWEDRERKAIQCWLLDRIEQVQVWSNFQISTSYQLGYILSRDESFCSAVAVFLGTDDYDLSKTIDSIMCANAVPFLACLRHTEKGLHKHLQWLLTWEKQRALDRGEHRGKIEVPPRYTKDDFSSPETWKLRQELDVPKERFISYPGAERDANTSHAFGWAGWNHLQRAEALASYFFEVKEKDAWEAERLIPLLTGLAELVPWLKHWHNDLHPDFGRLGDYYETVVLEEARELGHTWKDLVNWRPPVKSKGGGGRKKKADG